MDGMLIQTALSVFVFAEGGLPPEILQSRVDVSTPYK